MVLQEFTEVYKGLPGVKRGYSGLKGVTGGYMTLQGPSLGYMGLHGVARVNRGLQGVTWGYKRLQWVKRGRGNLGAQGRKERNTCKDAIVFSVFRAHILSVKIVIGQN